MEHPRGRGQVSWGVAAPRSRARSPRPRPFWGALPDAFSLNTLRDAVETLGLMKS